MSKKWIDNDLQVHLVDGLVTRLFWFSHKGKTYDNQSWDDAVAFATANNLSVLYIPNDWDDYNWG